MVPVFLHHWHKEIINKVSNLYKLFGKMLLPVYNARLLLSKSLLIIYYCLALRTLCWGSFDGVVEPLSLAIYWKEKKSVGHRVGFQKKEKSVIAFKVK